VLLPADGCQAPRPATADAFRVIKDLSSVVDAWILLTHVSAQTRHTNSSSTLEQQADLPASNMPRDSIVWLSEPFPCNSSNVSAALTTAASLAHGMGAKWLFVADDEGQTVKALQPDAATAKQHILDHAYDSTSAVQFCLVEGSSADVQEAQVSTSVSTCYN
jgi:hypothetical protein